MSVAVADRFRLEIGERNRSLVIVAVTSFLAAFGLVAYAVLGTEGAEGEFFPTQAVTSAKGGYALEAPAAWTGDKQGKVTTLSSRAKDVVVTIGPAPRGNLADAGQAIFDSVADTYSKVTFMGATEQKVDGRKAIVFSVKATNEADVRLRFVGVTFTDAGRNYSMTAFTPEDSRAERVLPRIETILNTFTATKK